MYLWGISSSLFLLPEPVNCKLVPLLKALILQTLLRLSWSLKYVYIIYQDFDFFLSSNTNIFHGFQPYLSKACHNVIK